MLARPSPTAVPIGPTTVGPYGSIGSWVFGPTTVGPYGSIGSWIFGPTTVGRLADQHAIAALMRPARLCLVSPPAYLSPCFV